MFKKCLIVLVLAFVPGWAIGEHIPTGVLVHQADRIFRVYPKHGLPQSPPTAAQILEWWKPQTKTEITKLVRITATGSEEAYLAAVYLPETGRNFQRVGILIRPSLKEVRQIDGLGYVFEVYDHDMKGASAIWTEMSASGHGTTERCKRALFFDGWNPVILHERWFGDNLGGCGEGMGHSCHASNVERTFVDLNGDGRADLVELIVEREGANSDRLVWTTRTTVFLWKEGEFVAASPSTTPGELE